MTREDIYQEFLGQGFHRDKHVRSIKILIGSWQFDEDVLSVLRVHQTYAGDNERSEYRVYWTSWQGMMKSKRDKMILSDMTSMSCTRKVFTVDFQHQRLRRRERRWRFALVAFFVHVANISEFATRILRSQQLSRTCQFILNVYQYGVHQL